MSETEPTYEIGLSLGFDDGKGSSEIDDTTFYIIIGVIIFVLVISSVFAVMAVGIKVSNSDTAGFDSANQKLPITINLTTSPQYYPLAQTS